MSGPRRGLGRGRAVAVVVALGALLFGLTLPTWASAEATTTVGTQPVAVGGSGAAPLVASAAAVVLVAGLVLALSGRLTRVLAVIGVVLGGVLGVIGSARFLADPRTPLEQAAAAVSGVREIAGDPDVTALPVLALVVSALTALTGLALPFLAGRWERVGRRYEVGPATGTAAAETHDSRSQARADWDALTRGDDPSEH